jgi:hypothetical protein
MSHDTIMVFVMTFVQLRIANNTYGGAITLSTNAVRINSDTGTTLTLSGGITNGGIALTIGGVGNTTMSTAAIAGTGTLTKDGSGTLTFNLLLTLTQVLQQFLLEV